MTRWFQLIRSYLWVGVLLAALMAVNVLAENPKVSYPPVPDWVHETACPMATNGVGDSKSAGTRCLLYEYQVHPKKAEGFVRVVELMQNANGVQDSGSLRLSFDPNYQELCVHRVVIHRDGKVIDRLNPSQVRIIQPEPGLNDDVFTGRQTAVLFIEDLRVGDVLEYAYTIRGANPVLKGHYSTRFTIQNDSPVDRQLFRVIWGDTTPLFQRLHQTSIQPVVLPWDIGFEYAWSYTNLPAIAYEDCQPASFEAYPFVEVTDFTNWGSVVDWALPLYSANPTNPPPEMRQSIAGWEASGNSDEERARLALQFVQDDLRYTGIELGPDSYRPADPVETFQKRFGDCKGKSMLLQFLLRQMNIESYPALVDSSGHESVGDRLPSPFAFDHCILQMELGGEKVWVDPTSSHQGGSVRNRHLRPFGKALVIRPGNDALEDVPRSRPENSWQQDVTSTFTLGHGSSPVEFTVLTIYRGASADDMRDQLASTDPNDLAKTYLNYYARFYPGITNNQALKILDDRQANLLTVKESYTITNLWQHDETDGEEVASFYADNLYNVLPDPDTRIRKTPLGLSYPLFRRQDVIVHLPDTGWQIPDLTTNLENEAFSFNYHRHLSGSMATYHYECQTKQAIVPVVSVPDFLKARNHLQDLLTDTLQRPNGKTSTSPNWLMIALAVFGAGATTVACIWYLRRINAASRSLPPPLPNSHEPLQGLGGWLILVAINLCLAPFVRLSTIGNGWKSYFLMEIWRAVAMPGGASYHPLYGPLLVFELLGNILFFILNLLALYLFFTKRKAFPRVFITLFLGLAVFGVLDDMGCWLIPSLRTVSDATNHLPAIRLVIYALIWTSYMIKSERVRATFTR